MTKRTKQDEELIMDFLAGQCDQANRQSMIERLKKDEAFRRHHDDIAAALKAITLLAPIDAPESLTADTMSRIRQRRCTDALVAREGLHRTPRRRIAIREIAAVAASLALLACVLVPSFRQAGRLATAGQCAAHVKTIGEALNSYADDNNQYLPSTGLPEVAGEAEKRRWLPSGSQPSVSNSEGLFRLVSGKYVQSSAFQCPGARGDEPQTFAMTAGMVDFPKEDFVSYSYQHSLAPSALRRNDPVLLAVADHMAILADNTPIFQGGRFRPDRLEAKAGDNHSGNGQNVLYLDTHVQWSDSADVGVLHDNIYLAEGVNSYDGDENPSGPTDSFLLPAYSKAR